jgi:uncharacterized protein
MTPLLSVTISLLVGGTAGFLAHHYRIPGGAIVAAMLSVAALHLVVPELVELDGGFRVVAQIMIGIVVGAGLRREPFRIIRGALGPVLVVVFGILLAAALSGVALYQLTGLALPSALLATVPGGAGDVTAAALELEQDAAIVASFHLIRQLAIFVVVATVFQFVFGPSVELDPDDDG